MQCPGAKREEELWFQDHSRLVDASVSNVLKAAVSESCCLCVCVELLCPALVSDGRLSQVQLECPVDLAHDDVKEEC